MDASCFYDQDATYPPTTLRQRGVERQSLRILEDLDWLAWPRDPGYSTFGLDTRISRMGLTSGANQLVYCLTELP